MLGLGHITPYSGLQLCGGCTHSALGHREGKSVVSALSDLVFSPPGFFPLWFYTDGPALEGRGLSCRHREMWRNQDSSSFGWLAVMLAAPGSPSLRSALGSRTRQQSKKGHKAP